MTSPFSVQISKAALKYFQHLDQTTQRRIRKKLSEIAADPMDVRYSKPLLSTEKRSARVGGYRILFLVTNAIVLVTDIDARGDVYKVL